MNGMSDQNQSSRLPVLLRRVLFIVVLLGTGSVVAFLTGAYSHDRGHPFSLCGGNLRTSISFLEFFRYLTGQSGLWISWLFPYNALRYVTLFLWGCDFALGVVLASWFVTESGWWRNWSGRCRAAIYSSAFLYGSMLTVTTQRWIHELTPNGWPRNSLSPGSLYADYQVGFHIPGTQCNAYYNDFSRPATDILSLLATLIVIVPLFHWLRSGSERSNRGFSIAHLLGLTLLFGFTLSYLSFLCEWFSPDTGFANLSRLQAVTTFFLELIPASILPCIAVLLVATGSRFNSWKVAAFIPWLLVMDMLFNQLLLPLSQPQVFTRCENPLAGGGRWAFQLGRISTVWLACWSAAWLGVSFNKYGKENGT